MEIIKQAPAASARPEIISLDVLLREVDEGRVQIPRFQRPYVWTPQMMRDLFQSVLNGYPIGSLLIWEPRDLSVPVMSKIGPIPASELSQSSSLWLVLDGHQRLATMYGVLRLTDASVKDLNASSDSVKWQLGYDLDAEDIRQMRAPDDFDNPKILPLRSVLRTVEFVKFARVIDQSNLSSTLKSLYLDRADGVQRALRDYRIPITVMRDGTVDDAVAIFSRINRNGRPMTADQMAVALTFHEGFNLEESIDEILGQLSPLGFGDISRTVILQSLLHAARQNFVKPNFDSLRKTGAREAIKNVVGVVGDSLRVSCEFLNREIGFSTGRLLPYALQLFLLGVYFRTADPAEIGDVTLTRLLARWFWSTSFSGWFASANSSEIEDAVRVMEAFAASRRGFASDDAFESKFHDRPLRPFPKTFDRRSARIRAMLLVQMTRTQLLDPITNEPIDGSLLMADSDQRDLPYVFRSVARDPLAKSPANRILLSRKHGSAVRDILDANIGNTAALETHAIDEYARNAINNRDIREFVLARERELALHEEQFLAQFDLKIGDEVERAEDEVDVEQD